MKILGLAAAAASFLMAQDVPPKNAIYIMDADVKEVLKGAPPKVDQQIRVVDMGKYNLAVGIIHRGPTREGAGATGISHAQETETYIITSGGGTLITGGKILDGRPSPPESEVTKVLNGPSTSGKMEGYESREVKPGDIIIIPFGVPHGWMNIKDHVDYLSVRPDPDHVLPAGYVNPALQKK
jgi:mannose-6-phosphate isomerase-like protein (cupin superfamily)